MEEGAEFKRPELATKNTSEESNSEESDEPEKKVGFFLSII